MLRAALFSAALFLPNWAHALCNGPSFWDTLPPADQSELLDKVTATPFSAGNLWQATNGDATLTIVGTMHLPDPRHDVMLDRTLPFLADAGVLLVEATLEDQRAMQTCMARNPDIMAITDGPTLPELLDEATWASIRDAATSRGVPGFMAAKMKPWFLSMALSIPPCAMTAMTSGEGGLDNMLLESAADLGVPVAPLEPWQDMLDLLSMGTFEEQIDALRMGLLDPDVLDTIVVTLTDFYFAGQSAMGWYITEYTKDLIPDLDPVQFDEQLAQMEQLLLIDRNINWIPVIEDAAETHDKIVIAFGAAHLFGDFGVLNLLEQNGWAISPL